MNRNTNFAITPRTPAEELVRTALGQEPADLVIRGGQLVDVFSGSIRPADVALKGERIALVGDVSRTFGRKTRVIDAAGMYLAPGLIDAHVHIEASMVSPTQFARSALVRGNTTILWETLWTGNILGKDGIRFFLEEVNRTPLKVFAAAASGVPSITSRLATPGHEFSLQDLDELLAMDQVATLGEVVYLAEVLGGDAHIHNAIRQALARRKQVDGSGAGFDEFQLAAYAASGVRADHEAVNAVEAINRIRNGMWLVIREGSGFCNLQETIQAITRHKVSPRRVCFCVDDKDINDVLQTGSIDYMVREAIKAGVDPVTAVQMGSLNAAEYLRLDQRVGGIAPGMIADILLVQDLEDFRAHKVIANGELVAVDGKLCQEIRPPKYPPRIRRTVHVGRRLTEGDFICRTKKSGSVRVRAIRVLADPTFCYEEIETLPVVDGRIELPADPGRDVIRIAMIERHGKTRSPNIGLGFTRGFGIRGGAVASCIAPDINQIILIGDNTGDMAQAANRIVALQGGIVVCKQGRVLAELALPVAGVMSDKPYEEVVPLVEKMNEAVRDLGCALPAPLMTLGFAGGVGGMPYLKISDKGLVDIMGSKLVPLEVD